MQANLNIDEDKIVNLVMEALSNQPNKERLGKIIALRKHDPYTEFSANKIQKEFNISKEHTYEAMDLNELPFYTIGNGGVKSHKRVLYKDLVKWQEMK
jgi:polyphosphate kinase